MIGKQFANRPDAPTAQMIDIIERAFALLEAQQIFRRRHQVGLGQDARIASFNPQLLVDLVTAHAPEVVTLRVEEEPFYQRTRIGSSGRVARPQAAVNIFERFLLVLGGILLHALDDNPFVHRRIDYLDLADSQFGDLFDYRF